MHRPPRAAGRIAAACWALLFALWVQAISGHPAPPPAPALLLAAALLSSLLAGLLSLARRLRPGAGPGVMSARLLLLVTVAALAVRFLGVGHELSERYYGDEGVYAQRVTEINRGEVFPNHFVYPHLLYYGEAFAVWLAAQAPGTAQALARALYGVEGWADTVRLLLRLVVAASGALAAVPAFRAAAALGGAGAGTLAGLLVVFSPLVDQGSKLNTCDVPSALFAALCLQYCAFLLVAESRRGYLLAGACAGLAAASKYPAGLVAVAIAAVWLYWRWRTRRFTWSLAAAAAVALLVFVAAMPALLVRPEVALFGRQGIFYGSTAYRTAGWATVTRESNLRFYLGRAVADLGLPVVLLAAAGVFGVTPLVRARLLVLAVHPAAALALLCSLRIAVLRNLYPLLPAAAVIAAVAAAGSVTLAARAAPGRQRLATVLWLAAALAVPVARTALQVVAQTRPSTRQLASLWIADRLPQGASVLVEAYGPRLSSRDYAVRQVRGASRAPIEEVREGRRDFLVLASYSGEPGRSRRASTDAWYGEALALSEIEAEFRPGRLRLGPAVWIYRVLPGPSAFARELRVPAGDLFTPSAAMRREGEVHYRDEHGLSVARGRLLRGSYRVAVDGTWSGKGSLRVIDAANREQASLVLEGTGLVDVELATDGLYFFQVRLPAGGRLRGLSVLPAGGAS